MAKSALKFALKNKKNRYKKGASPPFFFGKQHPKTVLIAF